jgi:hypothetical protein
MTVHLSQRDKPRILHHDDETSRKKERTTEEAVSASVATRQRSLIV